MEPLTQITTTLSTLKSDSNPNILFHLQTTLSLPTTPICLSGHVLIRPYHSSDALTLSRLANNPLIAARLRDRFPSPYTLSDAESFLSRASTRVPPLNFALCLVDNGAHVGGINLVPGVDVERVTFEIGYWLGGDFWGRGLATDALRGMARWSFERWAGLNRLEALPYGSNVASARVLEKAGFVLEGRRRGSVVKNGVIEDQLMFGLLREECLGAEKMSGQETEEKDWGDTRNPNA